MSLLSFKDEHRKSFRLNRKSKMKEKQTLLMSSNAKHRFWSIFQLIIEFSVKNYFFPDFRKHLSGMIKYSGFLLRNLKSKEMRFLLLVFFKNNLFSIPQISFRVFALFLYIKSSQDGAIFIFTSFSTMLLFQEFQPTLQNRVLEDINFVGHLGSH